MSKGMILVPLGAFVFASVAALAVVSGTAFPQSPGAKTAAHADVPTEREASADPPARRTSGFASRDEAGQSDTPSGKALRRAFRTLKESQWTEANGYAASHPFFGGVGADTRSEPDLRNTCSTIQALRASGVPADDRSLQNALVFVSRCQYPGEKAHGDVGGFALRPDNTRSQRPCGATTCMGVTSLLAVGVPPDDARVQRAVKWLQRHYTLDAHPGMTHAREGLYGYYYEFAKAMRALRLDQFRDAQGVAHDWRQELAQRLAAEQHPDGSWTNADESAEPGGRGPVVVTSYALLTLFQIQGRQ